MAALEGAPGEHGRARWHSKGAKGNTEGARGRSTIGRCRGVAGGSMGARNGSPSFHFRLPSLFFNNLREISRRLAHWAVAAMLTRILL